MLGIKPGQRRARQELYLLCSITTDGPITTDLCDWTQYEGHTNNFVPISEWLIGCSHWILFELLNLEPRASDMQSMSPSLESHLWPSTGQQELVAKWSSIKEPHEGHTGFDPWHAHPPNLYQPSMARLGLSITREKEKKDISLRGLVLSQTPKRSLDIRKLNFRAWVFLLDHLPLDLCTELKMGSCSFRVTGYESPQSHTVLSPANWALPKDSF